MKISKIITMLFLVGILVFILTGCQEKSIKDTDLTKIGSVTQEDIDEINRQLAEQEASEAEKEAIIEEEEREAARQEAQAQAQAEKEEALLQAEFPCQGKVAGDACVGTSDKGSTFDGICSKFPHMDEIICFPN